MQSYAYNHVGRMLSKDKPRIPLMYLQVWFSKDLLNCILYSGARAKGLIPALGRIHYQSVQRKIAPLVGDKASPKM